MSVKVHIRWMIRRDMEEVLEIERASFEYPWFEEDFASCLSLRNCIGMIAEIQRAKAKDYGRIVGFFIYELHETRLHILNFAVSYTCRREGVGRQMVEKLLGKLSDQRRTRITLQVRETNLPAQLFFKAMGFRAVSVLRAYYQEFGDSTDEDAYLMTYRNEPALGVADADEQHGGAPR